MNLTPSSHVFVKSTDALGCFKLATGKVTQLSYEWKLDLEKLIPGIQIMV